jgi:hypothetical protein
MVAVSRTYRHPIRARRPPQAATFTASLLGVVLLLAYFAAPPRLPLNMVVLVGLVCATLAMLLVVFSAREYGVGHTTCKIAFWRVGVDHLAGGLLFVLVLCWWLSPWAPIHPSRPTRTATAASDSIR